MQYRRIIRVLRDRLRPEKPFQGEVPVDLKSQVMEEACRAEGLPIRRIDERTFETTIEGRPVLFYNMNGPLSSCGLKRICDNKHRARKLLEDAGLSVPKSHVGTPEEALSFQAFAKTIGYPVVLKPLSMSQGIGVFTGISDDKSLKDALLRLSDLQGSRFKPVLMEKHHSGDDHRFIVVGREVVAVSKRLRAHVIGDGRGTVKALIEEKNEKRKGNPYLAKHLIPTNPALLDRLTLAGLALNSVPGAGVHVILRDISNLKAGGDNVDVTNTIHPGYKEIALHAIAAMPGMHYGGVDLLIEDAAMPPTALNHIVSEVEFSPGPGPIYPIQGEPRNTAAAVLHYYLRYFGRT